jgi:TDG/mug DNA glycosylase family protein
VYGGDGACVPAGVSAGRDAIVFTMARTVGGLPDVIADSLEVLFCGVNPGMTSAAAGLHFATGTNRFWRVLYLAGFTPRQLRPEEARLLLEYGCGITSAVTRPTVSAAELRRADFAAARAGFERKIQRYRPRYLAFLGKAACGVFLNQRETGWGLQSASLGGASVWVLPNPSGLNCAFTIGALTAAYGELRETVLRS